MGEIISGPKGPYSSGQPDSTPLQKVTSVLNQVLLKFGPLAAEAYAGQTTSPQDIMKLANTMIEQLNSIKNDAKAVLSPADYQNIYGDGSGGFYHEGCLGFITNAAQTGSTDQIFWATSGFLNLTSKLSLDPKSLAAFSLVFTGEIMNCMRSNFIPGGSAAEKSNWLNGVIGAIQGLMAPYAQSNSTFQPLATQTENDLAYAQKNYQSDPNGCLDKLEADFKNLHDHFISNL